jgi:hypothetical protein
MMSRLKMEVRVRCGISSYTARLHKCCASSTAGAETAVRRVVEKYLAGSGLKLLAAPECAGSPGGGVEVWQILIGEV